jgi:hypothetical protein
MLLRRNAATGTLAALLRASASTVRAVQTSRGAAVDITSIPEDATGSATDRPLLPCATAFELMHEVRAAPRSARSTWLPLWSQRSLSRRARACDTIPVPWVGGIQSERDHTLQLPAADRAGFFGWVLRKPQPEGSEIGS